MTNPPRQVLLFSGHMIDAPDRPAPRFPPEKVDAAARAIAGVLESLNVGAADLALAQGSSGGDILFLEACRQRGARLQLMLPLPEARFIEQSILPSMDGEQWRKRYTALKAALDEPPKILPVEPAAHGSDDVFARCNLWLLDTARAWGIEKLRFICLWDGKGGDGSGGTAHMANAVRRHGGKVIRIDIEQL